MKRSKEAWLGIAASWLVRPYLSTLRFHVHDCAGVLGSASPQVIWVFWHNRIFVVPHMFGRYFQPRRGAALTSSSKDGEILAAFIQRFSVRPIRGSSSRRGAVALLEMRRLFAEGFDLGITPDGPRGPRYRLNPGVITLAQTTGAPVLPMHIAYSRAWQLGSWDGFLIPKPFARVDITLAPLHRVEATHDENAFEAERARLETVLRAGG